jgi:ketosteroid isomerase-like protein
MTDKKADENAIRELDVQWGEAACRKDLDAVVGLYAPNGALVWPGTPAAHGTAAITAQWKEMMKIPGLSLSFTPDQIDIAEAGDYAIDFGKAHLGQDSDDGPVKEVDKYLVVWQKIDGKWKVLYDSYNSNTSGG